MSYVVLHADRLSTLLAADPVVPAADVPRLRDAVALFAEAGRAGAGAKAAVQEAYARGRAEGFEAGRTEGRAAGEAEMGGELFRLAVAAREGEARRRGEIARLALEVLRRIAADVGDDAMVTALSERAAGAVTPDQPATLRVPPASVEVVTRRLGTRPGLSIEADAALSGADCIVETALGRVHAGLNTQLAQIERIWVAG